MDLEWLTYFDTERKGRLIFWVETFPKVKINLPAKQ